MLKRRHAILLVPSLNLRRRSESTIGINALHSFYPLPRGVWGKDALSRGWAAKVAASIASTGLNLDSAGGLFAELRISAEAYGAGSIRQACHSDDAIEFSRFRIAGILSRGLLPRLRDGLSETTQ